MRKAPIKPFQQTPRAPARAVCDGHQPALLTPDLLQGLGGTLSANVLMVYVRPYVCPYISYSKGSPFPSPVSQNVALNSNGLVGAGFGETPVLVNLRQNIKSLVKS